MADAFDGTPPEVAAAWLAQLRDLGARAWQCWMTGDQRGSLNAANEAMPVAAAASAALILVIESQTDTGPHDEGHGTDASDWWG